MTFYQKCAYLKKKLNIDNKICEKKNGKFDEHNNKNRRRKNS